LVWNNDRLETIPAIGPQFLIANQFRERRHLHQPASTVIVLCVALFDAVLTGRHPFQIVGEPQNSGAQVSHTQRPRIF
jgi:hypothetical protein